MDGSDETSTAACTYYVSTSHKSSQTYLFECPKEGSRIHLSRLDDGVCDCCDGVDETLTECEDRCSSILEDLKEKERQLKETLTRGGEEKIKMIQSAVRMTSDRLVRYRFHKSLLTTLMEFRDRELGPRLQLETLIERHEHGLCAWYTRSNRTCDLEHDETKCPNVWSRETFPKTSSKKAKRSFSSVWNSLTTYDYEARTRHHTNRLARKQWDDVVKRVKPDKVIDVIRKIPFRVPLSEQKCQNVTVGDLLATNTSFRTNTQTSSVGFTYPWRAGPRYCDSYFIRAFQRVLGTALIPIRFVRSLVRDPQNLWHHPLSLFETPCDIYIGGELKRPLLRPEAASLRLAMSVLKDAIQTTEAEIESQNLTKGEDTYVVFSNVCWREFSL